MEQHITPQRIANSIGLDKGFTGTYLLVEGRKDIGLYKKFIDAENCKIKPTFGKYKMRDVYSLLSTRNFLNKVGIRDADFLRVRDNEKFDVDYDLAIFPTDYHDSEGMIIATSALEAFLNTLVDGDKLDFFENKHGKIRELIYSLCFRIGCLRLANKKYGLGLVFKPANPEGNPLKYKKFICDKTIKYLGDEKLLTTVIEYSKNRGTEISPQECILEKFNLIYLANYPVIEILNGHDLAHALFIVLKKGLKCNSKTLRNADCVEEMLQLAYGSEYFVVTELYKKLVSWQSTKGKSVIKITPHATHSILQ